MSMSTMEVAVFPIPNMVCFPGQPVQLHVFEPRYRQMIRDCLANKRWLGVSLPKQTLREKKPLPTVSENLRTNQSTYESENIFGAGPVRVDEVLDDGRMLITVDVKIRCQIVSLNQHLPYFLAEVLQIEDRNEFDEARFVVLDGLCKDILKEHYLPFRDSLPTSTFVENDLTELTFGVFRWCRMEPQILQRYLKMTSSIERADSLIRVLSKYLERMTPTVRKKPVDEPPPTLH